MSSHDSFTRRDLAKLLAALLASAWSPARAADGDILDQGIGGTGVVASPEKEEGDRGIGGTGVIGTIRKFGSIYVNDLRITYPKNAVVRIDGAVARAADLKIGQVVRVFTQRQNGIYSTRTINVTSEVVGPVEAVSAHSMTVLGQTVSLDGLTGATHWRVGDFVAVSGLRRQDGAIAASLISARRNGPARVAGVIHEGPAGTLMIGNLKLTGINRSLIAQRAFVEGRAVDQSLEVARANGEDSLFLGRNIKQLLIEAYVERTASGLRLGSGLKVIGGGKGLPLHRSVRAVIRTNVGANGRLTVSSVKAVRTSEHSGDARKMHGAERPGRRHQGPGGQGKFKRSNGPNRFRSRGGMHMPADGHQAGSFVPRKPRGLDPSGGGEGSGGLNGFGGNGFGGDGFGGGGGPGGGGLGGGGLGGGRR